MQSLRDLAKTVEILMKRVHVEVLDGRRDVKVYVNTNLSTMTVHAVVSVGRNRGMTNESWSAASVDYPHIMLERMSLNQLYGELTTLIVTHTYNITEQS